MKKILSVFVLMCLSIGLVGCGSNNASEKPSDVSEKNYDLGIVILEATNKYLEGDLTAEEALKEIDALSEKLEKSDAKGDLMLSLIALNITLNLDDPEDEGRAKIDVRKERDKIAEILNK